MKECHLTRIFPMFPFITIDIFDFKLIISTYSLSIGIGLVVAILIYDRNTKCLDKDYADFLLYSAIISAILGLITTYLFSTYVIFGKLFVNGKWAIAFMPGLLCSSIFLTAILLYKRYPILDSLNIIIPYLLIVHLFGRIGCFLAGCCFGKPTSCLLGVTFPLNSLPSIKYGIVSIHPTQLYEAFILLILYLIIIKISESYRLIIYLIGYGTLRFIIECFRGDLMSYSVSPNYSDSQILSLVFIFLGSLILMKNFLTRRST